LDRTAGLCTVGGTLTSDGAELTGNQPGGAGSGAGGAGSGGGGSTTAEETCAGTAPGCVVRNPFTVTALPTPTLSDIAAFRPIVGVDHMEPNGWFVTGLDANFFVTGGASTRNGTLLGYPASVRFTPIRWRWTYGDGAGATRSTPGAPWAAQGIREFDPTSTSHVYDNAGTYVIDLTIGYHADYSFSGSAWAPIDGVLWLPANRLVATVGGAKTVLVERDCGVSSGPGC
jgi:hypothetical protein